MILNNFIGLRKGDRVSFYEDVSRKPSLYDEEMAAWAVVQGGVCVYIYLYLYM